MKISVLRISFRLSKPVIEFMAGMGGNLMASVIILYAWFWIMTTLSKLDFEVWPQATIPYSSIGLIRVKSASHEVRDS